MATLDALARQPDVVDYAQDNQFRINFNNFPLLEFFCTEVNIPGITLGRVDRSTRLTNIPGVGDTITYEDFTTTFIVDEQLKNYREVHDWMVNIGFPYSHTQFMEKDRVDGVTRKGEYPLYSDLLVTILTSKNNPACRVKFYEAFPANLSGLTYTQAGTDIVYLTAEVTFAYMYYDFKDV